MTNPTSPTAAPTLGDITALESAHLLQTYRRQPVAFVRGQGVYLFDTDGRRYLDFLSGIGVASLGHAHPGLAAVLSDQVRTLLHTSNLYYHPLQGVVARQLTSLSGLERAFFCNSGTEAVEACLKFARRYWHARGVAGRTNFVALDHAFAGRTMGSLSVTWDEHYRIPFEPLIPHVTFVSPSDPDALAAAVDESTAAVIAEPIQGEGGVRPLSPAFAEAVASVCARTGTLLVADEVQSGAGRTGVPFHFQHLGWTPDLVSVGKAIGGGFPVGAALVAARVAETIAFGDHGTTYGGNLLACQAARFYLDQLTAGGLLDHVNAVAPVMESGLRALASRHPMVTDVRGRGLMWGLALDRDAAPVVAAALKQGLVVNRTAERVVRMLPPLVVSVAEIESGLALLDAALVEAAGGQAA